MYVRDVDRGEANMQKTITIGNYVSVQGTFIRDLADGRIEVQVGTKLFTGQPVAQSAAA